LERFDKGRNNDVSADNAHVTGSLWLVTICRI